MTDAEVGRATVKDVFDAVNSVRQELGDKIDALANTVQGVVTSHEHRLTVVEQIQTIHDARVTVLETEVKKHSDEISTTNERIRLDEATASALTNAKTKRSTTLRWVVGTLISCALVAASVLLTLFHP